MSEEITTFQTHTLCECIEIVKDVSDGNLVLGFAIGGGIDQDHSKNPFIPGDPGIFVTRVTKNGPAEKAGLKVGDKILQVNGYDVTMSTQKKARDKLVKNQRIVRMKVTRLGLTPSEESTTKMPQSKKTNVQEYV